QQRHVGPAQVTRRPRREGGPQVGRRGEKGAGDVLGGDAVGLGDRRQQLARPRQDRLRRVLVEERRPANPPAPYRRGISTHPRTPGPCRPTGWRRIDVTPFDLVSLAGNAAPFQRQPTGVADPTWPTGARAESYRGLVGPGRPGAGRPVTRRGP